MINHGVKPIFLFMGLLITTMGFSQTQTQQGYVKTRGRLDSNGKLITGQGLKGAVVYIKGRNSVSVEADNGAFSFPVPDKHFRVDSVRKSGYQLVDMEFCYKTREYSSTPVDILMEIPGQSIEDYMEDFDRINASQKAMINQLRAEVKQLKAQNKINEEEYSRHLAEIAEMQSESQKLVSEMAERYSKMDFDRLDDFNRQVSWLILNGELIKADSLIKSKGNMAKRSADLDQLHQANTEVLVDLEKSEALETKMLEDFAADCYNLYEICKLKHDNDSAAYWLELRASKDTTNAEWLYEAAASFSDCNQFQKAELYLKKALLIYQNLAKEDPYTFESDLAYTYNAIGKLYNNISNYYNVRRFDEAEISFNEALKIFRRLAKNNPQPYQFDISMVLNNMGIMFNISNQFEKCEKAYIESLSILRQLFVNYPHDYDSSILASTLMNLGVLYSYSGMERIEDCLSSYSEAVLIYRQLVEKHPLDNDYKSGLAGALINIGNLHYYANRYDEYEKAYLESLAIYRQLAEKNSYYDYDFAIALRNYGYMLFEHKRIEECEIAYIEALDIMRRLASDNPNTYKLELAITLNYAGTFYRDTRQFEKSKHAFNEALNIYESLSDYDRELLQSEIHDIYYNYGVLYKVWKEQGYNKK